MPPVTLDAASCQLFGCTRSPLASRFALTLRGLRADGGVETKDAWISPRRPRRPQVAVLRGVARAADEVAVLLPLVLAEA